MGRLYLCKNIMKKYIILTLWAALFSTTAFAQPDTLFYELRIYTAEKGKLNDLHKRFRNHTTGLFEKHGMTNVGYWTLVDNPDEKLYYVLSYPSRAARDKAWEAFRADTTWIRVKNASEVNGKLVAKVESIFLKTTDFSPLDLKNDCQRVWEMRIYTSPAGRLPILEKRFRNHTMNLFAKHGMKNIVYWKPTQADQGADNTLYYFLTHRSEKAAQASFGTFINDPEWQRVSKASEVEAGGPIISKIESLFLYPTDYSPLR
jgi:NIPSNAP